MLHQLPLERKIPQPQASLQTNSPSVQQMITIPGGKVTLGLCRDDAAFGWDNEYDLHSMSVPPFSMDRYKITNGHYLEFMANGGYENQALWTEADWNWKTAADIKHPAFWARSGDGWCYRGMFEEIPLPLDWPVYVSHAEASAYARWVKKSLPSEGQWHRAAFGTPEGDERPYPWGSEAPRAGFGNFDFRRWDPVSVNAHPAGESAWGLAGLVGNGWEWTSSRFAPFDGFRRFPFYPGYSADFFDGKHYVMKGGSARTAACMLRRSFRNWFQSHYQYVYAGFRCVSN
jgi:formylglycine-generating enzyme required for sulfatase activity